MANENHHLFLELFLKEEPLLRAFLLSATGSAEATDDLLQSAAAVLLDKWDDYDRARPFRPWALGIARLEVLKWRQQLARSRNVLSEDAAALLEEAAAEHAPEIEARQGFLLACIEELRDDHRGVLDMKYGLGLKIAEIARRIGKSAAAVEMILSRLRKILRDCIGRKAQESAGGS
jgi:RNA polymerase sigma-70 factor (ECF subfamily)